MQRVNLFTAFITTTNVVSVSFRFSLNHVHVLFSRIRGPELYSAAAHRVYPEANESKKGPKGGGALPFRK